MPKLCSAGGCSNHHYQHEKKLSFHVFPDREKEPERRQRWIWACGRRNPDGSRWKPTAKYIYLCSEHFLSGKPSKDPDNIDYVPSLFNFNKTPKTEEKNKKKKSRFNSATKRSVLSEMNLEEPQSRKAIKLDNFQSEDSTESEEKYIAIRLDSFLNNKENVPQVDFDENVEHLESGLLRSMEMSEREMFHLEVDSLRSERDTLIQKLAETESKLASARLSSSMIVGDNSKCIFYTGLKCVIFEKTFQFLNQFTKETKPGSLSNRDQFFITLVKLRLNPKFEQLADQVSVAKTTVIDTFWKWINLIEAKLSFYIHWPDRETIRRTVPPLFKAKFPRLTNIIDCFEIFIENPKKLKPRAQCYSQYKKHTTVKFLIGCSPLGAVIFLSRAWGGRVSDIELTRQSGYISRNYHLPGDQILADRGFTLQEELATECSAQLILPAFTRGKKQLSAQDVETSRSLASVRIHVERVIGLMKNRFCILQGILPVQMVNSKKSESEDLDLSSVDKIVRSCAILTNLGERIVYKDE